MTGKPVYTAVKQKSCGLVKNWGLQPVSFSLETQILKIMKRSLVLWSCHGINSKLKVTGSSSGHGHIRN